MSISIGSSFSLVIYCFNSMFILENDFVMSLSIGSSFSLVIYCFNSMFILENDFLITLTYMGRIFFLTSGTMISTSCVGMLLTNYNRQYRTASNTCLLY